MLPFRSPRGDIVDSRRLTSAAGAAINTMKSPASRTRFLSRLPSVLALALLTATIKGEKSTVPVPRLMPSARAVPCQTFGRNASPGRSRAGGIGCEHCIVDTRQCRIQPFKVLL